MPVVIYTSRETSPVSPNGQRSCSRWPFAQAPGMMRPMAQVVVPKVQGGAGRSGQQTGSNRDP
jgi:hypothetical protein